MQTIVQATCPQCASSIEFYPAVNAKQVECSVCQFLLPIDCSENLEKGNLDQCPVCKTFDFYCQKDFNRKIGVILFVLASIASFWTYGISFIVLYLLDFMLFQKLQWVVSCYKCSTLFRNIKNKDQINPFDHEKNDRIIYNKEQFLKNPLEISSKVL